MSGSFATEPLVSSQLSGKHVPNVGRAIKRLAASSSRSRGNKNDVPVEHLLEQLQTLEEHKLKEAKVRKSEELSRQKEIAAAKKRLGREISQTRAHLRRGNLEVGKLRQTLSKIERQSSASVHKKSVLGMELEDVRQKFEEKHNHAELELQQKIGAVSEAHSLLSYLEYAQEMLEQGVIFEPRAKSMYSGQEPLMSEGEFAELSPSSVESPLTTELESIKSRYHEAEEEWTSQCEQAYKDVEYFKNEMEALQKENTLLRQENLQLSDGNAKLQQENRNLRTKLETLPSATALNRAGSPQTTYPSSAQLIGHRQPAAAQRTTSPSTIAAPLPIWSIAGPQLHSHFTSTFAQQVSRSANLLVRSRSPSIVGMSSVLSPHGAPPSWIDSTGSMSPRVSRSALHPSMGVRSISAPSGALHSARTVAVINDAQFSGTDAMRLLLPTGATPSGTWAFSMPTAIGSLHSGIAGPIRAADQGPTALGHELRSGSLGSAPHAPRRPITPRGRTVAASRLTGGMAKLQEEQSGSPRLAFCPAPTTVQSERIPHWRTTNPQGSNPGSAASCARLAANGLEPFACEIKADLHNEVIDEVLNRSPRARVHQGSDAAQAPAGCILEAAAPEGPHSSSAFSDSSGKHVGLARILSFNQSGGKAPSSAPASPVSNQVERRVQFKDVVSKVTAQALREFQQNHVDWK
eukprot:TRINITY_DN16344_c0_g1_i1.p1 TRINITY_DN16344_c0_g1~~TRINITY_DN16344_c0_g1_i1.p1  ORF type:complete len:690 (-),score=83.20 TRINITY_DN16344_c0_g1_i1:19-2088(-)